MIGVFAVAGWSPSELASYAEKLTARLVTKSDWEASVCVTNEVACGRVGPKRPGAVWSSPDGMYRGWRVSLF